MYELVTVLTVDVNWLLSVVDVCCCCAFNVVVVKSVSVVVSAAFSAVAVTTTTSAFIHSVSHPFIHSLGQSVRTFVFAIVLLCCNVCAIVTYNY